MFKKMNNKGYMLVEVILAFSIAFILLYFITDLVIKMKNKNDDLLVKTLVSTDQAIVTNGLIKGVISDINAVSDKSTIVRNSICSKIIVDGNRVLYNDETITVVDSRVKITWDSSSSEYCDVSDGMVTVKMGMEVKQLSDTVYDVLINYRFMDSVLEEPEIPTPEPQPDSPTVNLSCNIVNSSGKLQGIPSAGVTAYGWSTSYDGVDTISVDAKKNVYILCER